MKIIGVFPKDVTVPVEFTAAELYFLQQYLGRCECTFDAANDMMNQAAFYVEKIFMPTLNDAVERITDDENESSSFEKSYCKWMPEDETNTWKTECGKMFVLTTGGPADNHMSFCHHCGAKIYEEKERES